MSTKTKKYIEGQPNVNDVLYGSGKGAYNHNGNQVFHAKVRDSLQEYYEVKTHRSKQEIALRVIREISSSDPPGRFLKYDKENSKWYEVEPDESLAKTQQQFRNRVSMDRKALRKSKEGPKEKPVDFRPENFNFNSQAVTEMSDASRVVLDLEIIEALGDIFLEVMDLNAKYANLNSKGFGSLVMNLPGRQQLQIFKAASTLVYATQADKASATGENNNNKRPRQGFVAASANARPAGNLAKPPPQPAPPTFVPAAATNPFVAPPASMALQGVPIAATVSTAPRPNDWAHSAGVAAANPPQVLPQAPPQAATTDGNNGSKKQSAAEPAATEPMNVDASRDTPGGNMPTGIVVNEENRIVGNELQSDSADTGNKDSSNQEENNPKLEPLQAQHVVMGTLVTLFVEVMRLQLENPKWDPLEHSLSVFDKCSQGKYASTLFEAASAFTIQSTRNENPGNGDIAIGADGQSIITASGLANRQSALGTLADVASESNSGKEVQVAKLKPLDGWNRFFVGCTSDDFPHGVGCLTYSQEGDDNKQESKQKYLYGYWSKGYLTGKGWETYANGSKYNGNFQQGVPKGSGKMIYANGLVREGNFDTWNAVLNS